MDIRSPHLENYLKRRTAQGQQPDLDAKFDLLWKFYEKDGQFINAVRVLSRLADTHSTAINSAMRVEYPSRAIVCTRVAETSSFGNAVQGEFLYELEEKMDGAEVQSQVLEAVSRFHSTDQQDVIGRLNSDLLDVTQLYEQFAEPLALWECKPAIVHCPGHHDTALVTSVWQCNANCELKKLRNVDPESKLSTLGSKLKTLDRLFTQSEQFFPTGISLQYFGDAIDPVGRPARLFSSLFIMPSGHRMDNPPKRKSFFFHIPRNSRFRWSVGCRQFAGQLHVGHERGRTFRKWRRWWQIG